MLDSVLRPALAEWQPGAFASALAEKLLAQGRLDRTSLERAKRLAAEGGFEFPLVLLTVGFAITALGPGSLSVDSWLGIDNWAGINWTIDPAARVHEAGRALALHDLGLHLAVHAAFAHVLRVERDARQAVGGGRRSGASRAGCSVRST